MSCELSVFCRILSWLCFDVCGDSNNIIIGVQYLIVVINKMDDVTVQWDVARYEECVGKLKPFLKSCGYVIKKEVRFLPISGLRGDNICREVATERFVFI